ncbi:hypothetical protein CDAR_445361 [Caerostris darwini]|uniref:Uncharacterized protein n=1 Tax=Caerostris darwini TaxID=1538125 RepID=A0AAV4S6D9_9ARAC|nr:hypothetical protein CDAR_445361 [Caerostris darwini]
MILYFPAYSIPLWSPCGGYLPISFHNHNYGNHKTLDDDNDNDPLKNYLTRLPKNKLGHSSSIFSKNNKHYLSHHNPKKHNGYYRDRQACDYDYHDGLGYFPTNHRSSKRDEKQRRGESNRHPLSTSQNNDGNSIANHSCHMKLDSDLRKDETVSNYM